MVVTMARSTRLTLLLLFTTACLFSTATAVVTTETAVPTNEHDWSWFVAKDYFCSDDNPEVQKGCRKPGTCFYPIHFANLSRCDFYVQCVMDKESLDKSTKTAKARLRSCGGSPESAEFSPLTRKCEPRGAEGTCSYYMNWERPTHWGRRLAARDYDLVIRDGPRGAIISTEWATKTFCKTNPEVNEGCKVKGGCKYSLYCGAYVECVMEPGENSTTATARFGSCPRTMEFDGVTRKCEPRRSPGTCSSYKKKQERQLVVSDGALPPWAHQDRPEQAAEQDFVDWLFCNNNHVEVAKDCKVEGGCKYARGDSCWSYVERVMIESVSFKRRTLISDIVRSGPMLPSSAV